MCIRDRYISTLELLITVITEKRRLRKTVKDAVSFLEIDDRTKKIIDGNEKQPKNDRMRNVSFREQKKTTERK